MGCGPHFMNARENAGRRAGAGLVPAEAVGGHVCPVDPQDALDCDSCQ
jgi:hypothetical protein